MMFHVEQNKKNLHCETKDYLVTGEKFKVYMDQIKEMTVTFLFKSKIFRLAFMPKTP